MEEPSGQGIAITGMMHTNIIEARAGSGTLIVRMLVDDEWREVTCKSFTLYDIREQRGIEVVK